MKKFYWLIIGTAIFWQGIFLFCYSEDKKEDKEESIFTRPKITYNAASLRDPFKPDIPQKKESKTKKESTVTKPALPPEILVERDVQGLIWGGSFPQAIIDNKVYKVGDNIGGARVASITKDGVTLSYAGQELKLSAPSKAVKKEETLKGGSHEESNS